MKIIFKLFLITVFFSRLTANAQIIINENFESGTLNPVISFVSVGSFNSAPGVKANTDFGSQKAFGFGRSTCGSNCFNNYTATLIVTFPSPTFVESISWKEMEIGGNWGSQGQVFLDDIALSGSSLGSVPINTGIADVTHRNVTLTINQTVTTIKLTVNDITSSSEIVIDDFQVTSTAKIVGYEYWFDNNFASKVTTPVSPISQLDVNTSVSTTGITTGIHSFNFRSWDNSFKYSSVLSQFFYKINPSIVSANRDIVAYEYWFDNDYTSVITQTVSNQQSVDLNTIITTGTITSGIHSFNIRFKDNTNQWSSVLSQFFYKINPSIASANRDIVAYEYWFDNDYTNAVTQTVNNQQSLDLNTIISTGAITNGIHSFNIRFKDNTNQWSSILSQFFYKINPSTVSNNREIVAYEYWFDNDYANAVSQTVSSQQSLNLNTIITTGTIANGVHSFNIRFKDNTKLWSSVLSQFFYKIPSQPNLSSNKITTYRYWFDNNFAQVNTVALSTPVKQLNLIDDLDLTQINKGMHSIHFQFKDSLNMWSVVTSDSIKKMALPIAKFAYTSLLGCASSTVSFTDNSIDADTYLWDFGDGNTSSLANPVHEFYNTGVYQVRLTITDTQSGLDSSITTPISIYMATTSSISVTQCNDYTAPDGTIYNTSGIKTAIIPNSVNCDSIISINLTIKPKSFSSITKTVCDSYTAPDGVIYTTSGTKTAILPNAIGCDSVITIYLTVNVIDKTVTQVLNTLTSNAVGASYQWLDCNNGKSQLSGENNQAFTAIVNGSYAVKITQNGCVDTSNCISINNVGIIDNTFSHNISVYPNPTTGLVTIDLGTAYDNLILSVYDNQGKLVFNQKYINNHLIQLNLDEAAGLYFIELRSDYNRTTIRVLKN